MLMVFRARERRREGKEGNTKERTDADTAARKDALSGGGS